jgi:hypothetical protein
VKSTLLCCIGYRGRPLEAARPGSEDAPMRSVLAACLLLGVPSSALADAAADRALARDERMLVSSFYAGLAFLDRLGRRLAAVR